MELTQKQETFTRNLFSGMSQYDAYRGAGYAVVKQTRATINANASRLANNVNVLAQLEVLNKKADDDSIATVKERKQILTEIIRKGEIDPKDITPRDRMTASDQLNKMDKLYTEGITYNDIKVLIVREKPLLKEGDDAIQRHGEEKASEQGLNEEEA